MYIFRITLSLFFPFSLAAPPDPAFLEWLMPQKGHCCGGEDIVIKGSKMTARKSKHCNVINIMLSSCI